MGLLAFEKNSAGVPSHSQDRPIRLVTEISTRDRYDHFDSKMPMLKQAR